MIFTTPTVFDDSHGVCGPNDRAYKAIALEKAAANLRTAIGFHVGYSHSSHVTKDHPLVLAMKALAEEHRECVSGDNRGHDPALFEVPDYAFVPSANFWQQASGRKEAWWRRIRLPRYRWPT